jgi:hypothetical protein
MLGVMTVIFPSYYSNMNKLLQALLLYDLIVESQYQMGKAAPGDPVFIALEHARSKQGCFGKPMEHLMIG